MERRWRTSRRTAAPRRGLHGADARALRSELARWAAIWLAHSSGGGTGPRSAFVVLRLCYVAAVEGRRGARMRPRRAPSNGATISSARMGDRNMRRRRGRPLHDSPSPSCAKARCPHNESTSDSAMAARRVTRRATRATTEKKRAWQRPIAIPPAATLLYPAQRYRRSSRLGHFPRLRDQAWWRLDRSVLRRRCRPRSSEEGHKGQREPAAHPVPRPP